MKSLRSVNLNLVPVLHALLEQASVSRAAQVLNLSQSATSDALARLREIFDDPLLVRDGQKLRLSPLAESLLEPLGDVVGSLGRLFEDAGFDVATAQRTFTIATADPATFVLGQPLLRVLCEQTRNLSVRFLGLNDQSAHQLEIGILDFAIFPRNFVTSENIQSQKLFDMPFVGIADEDNTGICADTPLEEYCALPHVVFQADDGEWVSVEAATLSKAGIHQRNIMSVTQFMLLPFLIRGTSAVSIVQRQLADALAQTAAIKIFEPPIHLPPAEICLCWNETCDRDPAHRWMREAIIKCAGN